MNQTLSQAFGRLAMARPCFHSEADFQFALGWQIKEQDSLAEVRLEVPMRAGSNRYKLDLFFRSLGWRIAVELKYFKAPLQVSIGAERFELIDAVAHDINRYDFLKDVQRMEHLLGAGLADEAYAIVLTNQPKYWEQRSKKRRVDEQFGLEQGRILERSLTWADHVGGTSKGRERSIQLRGRYALDWRDYSEFADQRFGLFRVLSVQAVPGCVPVDVSFPPCARQVPKPARRPRYEALAEHLSGLTGTVVMTLREIEALTGPLPISAREYREWWANHGANPQAKWMSKGWKIESVDLGGEQVEFVRR